VLVILVNILGFYLISESRRALIKFEVRHQFKFNKNNLKVINSKNNITWLGSDEILFEGKMFDVVKKTNNYDGSINLLCYNDIKENDLNNSINNFYNNNKHDNSKKTATLILKLLSFVSLLPQNNKSVFCCEQLTNKQCDSNFYKSIKLAYKTPPPKIR